jgi:hypothetical protein
MSSGEIQEKIFLWCFQGLIFLLDLLDLLDLLVQKGTRICI